MTVNPAMTEKLFLWLCARGPVQVRAESERGRVFVDAEGVCCFGPTLRDAIVAVIRVKFPNWGPPSWE